MTFLSKLVPTFILNVFWKKNPITAKISNFPQFDWYSPFPSAENIAVMLSLFFIVFVNL